MHEKLSFSSPDHILIYNLKYFDMIKFTQFNV